MESARFNTMKGEAQTLSDKSLWFWAKVSIGDVHQCRECWVCACREVFKERMASK